MWTKYHGPTCHHLQKAAWHKFLNNRVRDCRFIPCADGLPLMDLWEYITEVFVPLSGGRALVAKKSSSETRQLSLFRRAVIPAKTMNFNHKSRRLIQNASSRLARGVPFYHPLFSRTTTRPSQSSRKVGVFNFAMSIAHSVFPCLGCSTFSLRRIWF